MNPDSRVRILLGLLVALSVAAVVVWSLNNRPPNHRVLPAADYYTGPMRGPSHPNRLVDEDGHIYSTDPAPAGGSAAPGRPTTGVGSAQSAR